MRNEDPDPRRVTAALRGWETRRRHGRDRMSPEQRELLRDAKRREWARLTPEQRRQRVERSHERRWGRAS